MLSSTFKRTVLVVASSLILTGCSTMPGVPERPVTTTGTPEPFPCAYFADAHWKEFRFGFDTQDDVIATAGRIWGIEREGFRSPEPDNFHPFPRLSWEVADAGVRYIADFYEEGPLKEIDFETGSFPTLRQVIDCFGTPEFYSAYWHRNVEDAQIILNLWYVDRGIVFSHSSWGQHHRLPRPPPFPHELSMHFATLLPSGDVAQMINVHFEDDFPNRDTYVLCILKPWPGTIEAMEDEIVHYGYVLPPECEEPTPESGVSRLNSGRL